MTLEQVNALITILDLSNVVKDGLCVSEPILCKYNNIWIDVFFTYGINYDEENYSGPISVFGINSEKKEISFVKKSSEYNFSITADEILKPSDWCEEGSKFYDDYAIAYEKMRLEILGGERNDISEKVIREYIELLKKYTDESLWGIYSILLKDIYKYLG